MIRIIVYGQPFNGLYSYRIDGHWGPEGAPLIGLSEDPFREACRVLKAMGVHDNTVIAYKRRQTTLGEAYRAADGWLINAPVKALPPPRQTRREARRRVLQVRGSGVPGDG